MSIPFNKPFISGKEKEYIASVIDSGLLIGEGHRAVTDKYSERLVRLPLYYDLSAADVQQVCEAVLKFYTR